MSVHCVPCKDLGGIEHIVRIGRDPVLHRPITEKRLDVCPYCPSGSGTEFTGIIAPATSEKGTPETDPHAIHLGVGA